MTTTTTPTGSTTTAATTPRAIRTAVSEEQRGGPGASRARPVQHPPQRIPPSRHTESDTIMTDINRRDYLSECGSCASNTSTIPGDTAVAAPADCSSCGGGSCGTNVHTPADATAITVLASHSYTSEVKPTLWNRLVLRITKDAEFREKIGGADQQTAIDFAGRILNQAVGFLGLIARNPGVGFSPSPLVDIGWHNFILYTREYAQFCDTTAGRFIHHTPFDEVGVDYGTGHAVRTVEVLRTSGWPVDDLLWISTTLSCDAKMLAPADCGQCEPSRGYDCGSCSTRTTSSTAPRRLVANNGNCGSQGCSDSCGGPDGLMTTTQRSGVRTLGANNGNCGSQDNGDSCGGGQDGGSDGN